MTPSLPAAAPVDPTVHQRYCRLMDDHFRGRANLAAERELRAHLPICDGCREYYDRHLRLSLADPAGLPSQQRLALGLGLAPRPTGARGVRFLAPAAAVGLAAVLVVAVAVTGVESPMQPRSGASPPGSQLLVYEVARVKDRPPRQVLSDMGRDSGLAFAYANISRKPHLAVFAVDENRRVYWYHPAWRSLADNPVAVSIATDDAIHEIPQTVYHRFEGSQIQLFAVFADRPISVRELEAAVSRTAVDGQGRLLLALPDAQTTRLDLTLVDER